MTRRPGIATFLIGLFVLNGVLCPCAPLEATDIPETVSAPVAQPHDGHDDHRAHAGHDGTMPAKTGEMADCHTDKAVDECSMAEASDAEATGNGSDRSLEPNKTTASYAIVTVSRPTVSPSVHLGPGRQPPPTATPIRNRDRLLI